MDVGFQRRDELEAELPDERDVAPDLLEYRIDQHRLVARPIAQQVGVGRGLWVEQLTEHQHCTSSARAPRVWHKIQEPGRAAMIPGSLLF